MNYKLHMVTHYNYVINHDLISTSVVFYDQLLGAGRILQPTLGCLSHIRICYHDNISILDHTATTAAFAYISD